MKKRIVSITLAVVMTSFLLTGCNKENIANEDNNNTETDSGDGLSTLDSSDTTESEPDADVADSSDTFSPTVPTFILGTWTTSGRSTYPKKVQQ